MTRPLADLARNAYASGWALSGGPMTPRVRAGCVAAVEAAIEHADDPGVLEATLQIGKLEGTWALIFKRREDLITDHVARLLDAWHSITKDLHPTQMARGVDAVQYSVPAA